VLVVPGGGGFADAVRDIYAGGCLSDDAAHWMAVLAMEQYAYYLADQAGVPLSGDLKGGGLRIVLPYEMLKADDILPHSWDVTSDTIAAWIALRSGAHMVKATDVDGVFDGEKLLDTVLAQDLPAESCVDRALPGFLKKNRMDVFVVNGLYPDRVISALRREPTIGTMIRGK
jgi:aspartokinase-like uncharacterized kinase